MGTFVQLSGERIPKRIVFGGSAERKRWEGERVGLLRAERDVWHSGGLEREGVGDKDVS